MSHDCLKLTVYCSERARRDDALVCDLLLDLFQRNRVETSILLRGIGGFGLKHHLRTDRTLTLSEDLPLVIVAVDSRELIERLLPDVREIVSSGTVTLERARLLHAQIAPVELPEELHEATKLTIYCGRSDRAGGRPAYIAVVDCLREHGIAGATVLLGLDGTYHGARERARFFSRNPDVPLMIVSVGDGHRIARALPEVSSLLPRPIMTLERIRVCKRDGKLLAEPRSVPHRDEEGMHLYGKLMIYAGEQARTHGHPLHTHLIRELRASRAAGATSLRGIWGYSHDGPPHGDRFLALRRHVPVVTAVVDQASRLAEAFAIVDRVTAETGLVTSEIVPAFQALTATARHGDLGLAGPRGFDAPARPL